MVGLTAYATYYVRAYATNGVGTGYGDAIAFQSGTVKDVDGNVYRIVQIGSQLWMAENLRATHYRNGDTIFHVYDGDTWSDLTTGAWCDYGYGPPNLPTYGCLYNWYAVADSRKIAPEGWHVPTDDEWIELEMCLGMSQSEANGTGDRGTDEGGKLKEAGTTRWRSPNVGATNESDFTALPGGRRHYEGYFEWMGEAAMFWSSTEFNGYRIWMRQLAYVHSAVYREAFGKGCGSSVRCVRDIVPEQDAPLEGEYYGSYSVTRDYGTPSQETMMNNILWKFSDKLYWMNLDPENNTGDCFCRVHGEYVLTEGVRLKICTSVPAGSDLGCTSCESNDDPEGTFVRLSGGDTLILRLREGSTFKEIRLLKVAEEEEEEG